MSCAKCKILINFHMSSLLKYTLYLLTVLPHSQVITLDFCWFMFNTFFYWGATKEARTRVIAAGLENPTPDVSRAIVEAEAASKGRCSYIFYTLLIMLQTFHFPSSPIIPITLNVSHLLADADKKPADSLTRLAALDNDNLLAKTQGISKGVLFNVQQALLKEGDLILWVSFQRTLCKNC